MKKFDPDTIDPGDIDYISRRQVMAGELIGHLQEHVRDLFKLGWSHYQIRTMLDDLKKIDDYDGELDESKCGYTCPRCKSYNTEDAGKDNDGFPRRRCKICGAESASWYFLAAWLNQRGRKWYV